MTKFNADLTWWLDEEKEYWQAKDQDNYWAEQRHNPGYHLVNVKGLFGDNIWQAQEDAIAGLNPDKARCFEEVLSEIIITTGLVTGEKICPDWTHWGRFVCQRGFRVYVSLHYNGVFVGGCPAKGSDSCLRVALFWKFNA